jgi:hypothetical protein
MQLKLILFTTLFAIVVGLTGCGGAENNNTNTSNSKNVNANVPSQNVNGALETTKKPDAEKSNDAPTLRPVVDAYYDALRKKDDAAVKKVLADAYIKKLMSDMKEEKATSLAAYLAEYDQPKGNIEVRNEKITSDTATAEIKGGSYLNWTAFGFVNENGAWKFSGKNPDVQAVDQTKGK